MTTYSSEVLVDGRFFCEGPRWHDGRFWFSDFYAHEVCSVDLDGHVRVEVDLGDEQPSGLGWTPNGELLVVGMTRRQVLAVSAGGELSVRADLSDIATFHANDMIVMDDGSAYVGNFGFDLDAAIDEFGEDGLFGRILDDPSAYTADIAVVGADGSVGVAATDVLFPNGMVLLGDTLIVAATLGAELTAFDRLADGTLANRRTWASLADVGGQLVLPDGLAAGPDATVWVANALAPSAVRIAEGGVAIDEVTTSQNAYACALGGPDGHHLLVCTAPSSHRPHDGTPPRGRLEIAVVS